MASTTAPSSKPLGRGDCTKMPWMSSLWLRVSTKASSSSWVVEAGRAYSSEWMPVAWQAFFLLFT